MSASAVLDPGSFRDPDGRVFRIGEKVFRSVTGSAARNFARAEEAGVMRKLVDRGQLVDFTDVTEQASKVGIEQADVLLSHPQIPFISYPYEWSFSLHKAAALAHLDLHLELLSEDFTLVDATAYNMQFDGTRPVHIDHLSIRPYEDGEIWAAHRQFCMQFLNPLLMWSMLDLQPNHWFRGSLEGIAPEDLATVTSIRGLTVAPNSRIVAYLEQRWDAEHDGRVSDIWRADVAGGIPERLTFSTSGEWSLSFSADSDHLYFLQADPDGQTQVFRMPVDGGGTLEMGGRDRHVPILPATRGPNPQNEQEASPGGLHLRLVRR